MKNAIWILMIILVAAACSGPTNEYRITGKVDGATPGMVVLSKVVDNELVAVDSIKTSDGTFSFAGTIGLPEVYYLEFKADGQFHRFFVEPAEIVVSGNVNAPVFEGSEAQETFKSYNTGVSSLDEQRQALYAEFREAMNSGDTARVEQIKIEAQQIDDNQDNFIREFVRSQKSTVVGPYIVVSNIYQFDLDDLEGFRANFTEDIADSKYISLLDEQIEKMRKVAIGQPAPVFSQNDTTGTPVSLTDFKGKYLLVDFWASWCGPCRQENPNVVAAFQKYHNNGFDILGVSLDRTRDKWIKAIADDNLTWTHVSDLKYWNNEASNMYAVSSIPANFLIDPDGIIIAKDLRGEELHSKLEELFD